MRIVVPQPSVDGHESVSFQVGVLPVVDAGSAVTVFTVHFDLISEGNPKGFEFALNSLALTFEQALNRADRHRCILFGFFPSERCVGVVNSSGDQTEAIHPSIGGFH